MYLTSLLCLIFLQTTAAPGDDVNRLVGALLGPTSTIANLQQLSDEIGGRLTGSQANLDSVDWALERFRERGVSARKEAFTMPRRWLPDHVEAVVRVGKKGFSPRMVSMGFSVSGHFKAPLLDGGTGSEADFARLGTSAREAFILVVTPPLQNIDDLFAEYAAAVSTEGRAIAAGAKGLVYMSSRPKNLLNRHVAWLGDKNKAPMLVMEREAAKRAQRLLHGGHDLELDVTIVLEDSGSYTSYNVIGEIPGSAFPEQVVIFGAHLDSWDLGTGALDNGCNVAMLIEIAAQIQKLGLKPKRTLRFALWNGEEQGLMGSAAYTQRYKADMDNHILATSIDIGSGRITGFFTGGRPEILPAVARSLEPVAGLGPFVQVDVPIVGTDNYDFMIQGIANLVANQESANYGPNYHARSDTFDKVDQQQLRLNSAIVAAVMWYFSGAEIDWKRQDRTQVEALINATDLKEQMISMGVWDTWLDGTRAR